MEVQLVWVCKQLTTTSEREVYRSELADYLELNFINISVINQQIVCSRAVVAKFD